MKHTLREILAWFAKHAEHTHEAAAQATYDLGHERGLADAKEAHEAAATAAPVPQRPSGDLDEEKDRAQADEETSAKGKAAKGVQA